VIELQKFTHRRFVFTAASRAEEDALGGDDEEGGERLHL